MNFVGEECLVEFECKAVAGLLAAGSGGGGRSGLEGPLCRNGSWGLERGRLPVSPAGMGVSAGRD